MLFPRFYPSNPTVLFRCLLNPRWSLFATVVVSRFRRGTLQNTHVLQRKSPPPDSHTRSLVSSTRFYLWGERARVVEHPPSWSMQKAAEVSASSHHPRLRWCGGGTSASTASAIVVVSISTIPIVLQGWTGWLGVDTTLAITRRRCCPSDINNCRSNCRFLGAISHLSVGCKVTSDADLDVYDVMI